MNKIWLYLRFNSMHYSSSSFATVAPIFGLKCSGQTVWSFFLPAPTFLPVSQSCLGFLQISTSSFKTVIEVGYCFQKKHVIHFIAQNRLVLYTWKQVQSLHGCQKSKHKTQRMQLKRQHHQQKKLKLIQKKSHFPRCSRLGMSTRCSRLWIPSPQASAESESCRPTYLKMVEGFFIGEALGQDWFTDLILF